MYGAGSFIIGFGEGVFDEATKSAIGITTKGAEVLEHGARQAIQTGKELALVATGKKSFFEDLDVSDEVRFKIIVRFCNSITEDFS